MNNCKNCDKKNNGTIKILEEIKKCLKSTKSISDKLSHRIFKLLKLEECKNRS